MLIEQILKSELREPGPPAVHVLFTPGYFHDKTKISKKNLRVDHYLMPTCCRRQCTLLPLPRPKHLPNLISKCKVLDVFWT